MNPTAKRRSTEEWTKEAREYEEQEAKIEQRLHQWKRGTAFLGVGLITSILAVVPFLTGYPLHDQWDVWGKQILLVAMFLVVMFIFAAGTTCTFWWFLRGKTTIQRKFAPPSNKHGEDT